MRRVVKLICLCTCVALAEPAIAFAQPSDWSVERDPFDASVIARYKALLARDPFDRALAQLATLYRKYRSVVQLERELAAVPESWATTIVLARLAEERHDPARALAYYRRAAELDDRDARTFVALGDACTDADDARRAFEHALALVPPRALQHEALRKLIALGGTAEQQDDAYARLVALDPTDGRLWLDRADMLVARGLAARSIDAYTTALPLLVRDPERAIYALAQRGLARQAAGDPTGALADYRAAIARAPRGYQLVADIFDRIIAIYTERGTLPELVRDYERAWPEPRRGHDEWATLARLHEATGDLAAAIAALERAVAKAPGELESHHKLVELLDRAGRADDALARLEAAARIAPRDASIQLALVDRYWLRQPDKVLATLAGLTRTHARDAGVRHDVAELYMKLGRTELAIREYAAVLRLEPDDANITALGEAYWVPGDVDHAVATWQQLARADTAAAYAALASLLAEHGLAQDALVAYSRAIDRDAHDPELWRARGAVYEGESRWSPALSDTARAVALLGTAPRDEGHTARYQLVRILVAMHAALDDDTLEDHISDWELAFAVHDDVAAGYLLAEYYGRQPQPRLASLLERLCELAPGDHGLVLELVRAYRVIGDYDSALRLASHLRRAEPERAQELDPLIARIRVERARPPLPTVWERSGAVRDPEAEILASRELHLAKDAVRGAPIRYGMRVGVGTGLRGPASRTLTTGAIATFGTGPIALVTRIDWQQREGQMRSVSALAGSVGVAGRIATTRSLLVTLGAAQRFEHRLGEMRGDWEQTGFAADFTLDVVPRFWPTALGARLEQGLSEGARSSMLLFEMSIEMR